MTDLAGFARRNRWALTVAAGLLLLVAYHVVWLIRMRNGFATEIDEAGYLNIAYANLDAFHADGLRGLWNSYSGQGPHAPLVPLLAVPFLEIRTGILPAFGVEWLAFLVVGSATYGLARTLMSPPWSALAVLTVVAMPGVINYTREFAFALPCAALFTVALLALVRSRNFSSLPLALAFGAAAGLAALSRTMALGLLPGLLLGALLWSALAPAPDRRRNILNLGAGVLAGLAVASTWYVRNMGGVLDYLTGFGYGSESSTYGESHPLFSVDRWTHALYTISWQELFVPLLYLSTAIVLFAAGFGIRRLWGSDRRQWLARVFRSPAMPVAIFVGAGYVALSSTANAGSVFALPILPAGFVLLVGLVSRFPFRPLRLVMAGALIAAALLQLVSFAQVWGPAEKLRGTNVPGLGYVSITDPRSPMVGATSIVPAALRLGDADRGWIDTGSQLGAAINRKAESEGRTPILAMGNRDRVLNTNLLQLSARLTGQPGFPLTQVTPAIAGDTRTAYTEFLSDPVYGQPNVLVTSSESEGDLEPVATQSEVAKAARRVGFTPFRQISQPNGEVLTLWWIERGPAIPSPPRPPVPDRSG